MAANSQDEQRIALFIDFENIAIGVRDAHYRKFDINLVLERLLEKGKVLVKKAYADWSRYSDYKRSFHEAAIELIEVPQKSVGGKNSADIRLVVDAMDMSFQKEHITSFVVASGDSDFSPLVSKLKENNKYVIGLGVKNSTSDLLIENCDEFIFYEDLVRGQQRPLPQIANVPEKVQECFALLVDSVLALQRENKEVLWGSMVKETMKRKKPSFNETYYGFRTFSHLLEDAQRRGIVSLRRDQKSGSYVVEDLGAASVSTGMARSETATVASSGSVGRVAESVALGPRPLEGAAVAAVGSESGESSNGRPTRRRRSRGRGRGRVAQPMGGGVPGSEAAMEAEGADLEDVDEGDDHDNGGEGNDEPAAESENRRSDSQDHGRSVAESGSSSPANAEPERPGFSFFSWIRRDPAPPAALPSSHRAEDSPKREGDPE